jgi:hypothetical protein
MARTLLFVVYFSLASRHILCYDCLRSEAPYISVLSQHARLKKKISRKKSKLGPYCCARETRGYKHPRIYNFVRKVIFVGINRSGCGEGAVCSKPLLTLLQLQTSVTLRCVSLLTLFAVLQPFARKNN